MCLLGGSWELEGKQFRVCATHPKPHTVPLLITYLLTQHSDGWGFMVCDLAYLDLTISILIKLTKKSGVTKWQRCTDLSNACPCCLNGHTLLLTLNELKGNFRQLSYLLAKKLALDQKRLSTALAFTYVDHCTV